MKAVLTYILAFAAVAIAVALAAEQLGKAGKKNQLPHVTNNALALSGGILAVLGGGFAVFAFTGTLAPLVIFASLISVVLGSLYAWRIKREKATKEMWEALLTEEEEQASQTAQRDPANAAAWERLSELKVKRGDLRGALELFTKVCELEPTRRNNDRLAELREAVLALPPPKAAATPKIPD
ncbi:MAG: hypothetical protein A2X32_09160 [Elusimicrobia bacterium GWC2_64_44]|nr:MAG: hypothetical protein A2X32_09160 [Elusimicrobia bacterium GWC2_64_44]